MTAEREWDAAKYHAVSEPQLAWGERVLARLDLRGDEIAVDAGCGTGRVTARLAGRLPRGRTIGVDRSLAMAVSAGVTLAELPADVVAADLLALPLASSSADVVFSTAVFHWIKDHDALFTEIGRVLRRGGALHAQCGGAGNISRAHGFAKEVAGLPEFANAFEGWEDPWNYATPEETEARLASAGFAPAHAWLDPAPTPFPTAAACAEFAGPVILRTWLSRLPSDDRRARFVDAVVERIGRVDPEHTLDYVRLNIEAVRG